MMYKTDSVLFIETVVYFSVEVIKYVFKFTLAAMNLKV